MYDVTYVKLDMLLFGMKHPDRARYGAHSNFCASNKQKVKTYFYCSIKGRDFQLPWEVSNTNEVYRKFACPVESRRNTT
jgi:hypothetical protein